jgi:hypothetical protein
MSYLTTIGLCVVAGVLIRLYGPTKVGIIFLHSGVERGVGFNIVAFWLLIALAIGVAIAFVLQRTRVG